MGDTQDKSEIPGNSEVNSEIGYKKPPVAHQWPKGTSGNPNGRPKGRSLTSVLFDVLDEEARLKDRQEGHGVSKRELLVRNLYDHVLKSMNPALVKLMFEQTDQYQEFIERIEALEEALRVARGLGPAGGGGDGDPQATPGD